jgi:hypothetical protein
VARIGVRERRDILGTAFRRPSLRGGRQGQVSASGRITHSGEKIKRQAERDRDRGGRLSGMDRREIRSERSRESREGRPPSATTTSPPLPLPRHVVRVSAKEWMGTSACMLTDRLVPSHSAPYCERPTPPFDACCPHQPLTIASTCQTSSTAPRASHRSRHG